MSDRILTLNAGSSSLKFALFSVVGDEPVPLVKGQVEAIGTRPHFIAKDAENQLLAESYWEPVSDGRGHARAFRQIWTWLQDRPDGDRLAAIGHRVAHGGEAYSQPVVIDDAVLAALTRLIPLVPLHQPSNLAAIRAVAADHPELLQVACFDTGFHSGRPGFTERFALPRAFSDQCVKRYGFHGLSYEFIAMRLKELAPRIAGGRVVAAHLGSGCSMAALHQGRSVDTTMSFSALDGLPMGTRCGALDPGVILYLMREHGFGVERLERLLYKESGLLGLSGVSNDLRDLHASADPRAAEALEYFVYRIVQTVGALSCSLGGLDALVFTAGVGEHDAALRASICEWLRWLGIELDHAANAAGDSCISAAGSLTSVWVIPTDEEQMIARHTLRLARGIPDAAAQAANSTGLGVFHA